MRGGLQLFHGCVPTLLLPPPAPTPKHNSATSHHSRTRQGEATLRRSMRCDPCSVTGHASLSVTSLHLVQADTAAAELLAQVFVPHRQSAAVRSRFCFVSPQSSAAALRSPIDSWAVNIGDWAMFENWYI